MSKTFQEWWREGQPRRYALDCAQAAWNWQQVTIDDLRAQRDELLAALKPFAAGYDTPAFREAAINAVADAEQ